MVRGSFGLTEPGGFDGSPGYMGGTRSRGDFVRRRSIAAAATE